MGKSACGEVATYKIICLFVCLILESVWCLMGYLTKSVGLLYNWYFYKHLIFAIFALPMIAPK